MSIKIVTYNILSPQYVYLDLYPKCQTDDLNQTNRIKLIGKKLLPKMRDNFIICLQEVCRECLDMLIELGRENNYGLTHVNYNDHSSKQIYLVIMYPSIYRIEHCYSTTPLSNVLDKVELDSAWLMTHELPNRMLVIKFLDTITKKKFIIATTHFPFLSDQISTIYIIQFIQILQMNDLDLPIIFTGDFNFTPESYQYKIVVTGIIDIKNPAYPKISNIKYPRFNNFKWNTCIDPMTSALDVMTDNKNYTLISFDNRKLILDHIFCYNCKPCSMTIENDGDENVPLPNKSEPSDHLMVYSDINL